MRCTIRVRALFLFLSLLPHPRSRRHQSHFNRSLVKLAHIYLLHQHAVEMGTHKQSTAFPRKWANCETCSHVIYTLQRFAATRYTSPIQFHFISFSVLFKTLCQFRMHFNLFAFSFYLLLLLLLPSSYSVFFFVSTCFVISFCAKCNDAICI